MLVKENLNESISDAIDELRAAFKEDSDYRYAWQSNIAMAYVDEARRNDSRDSYKTLHKSANDAADNFLTLLVKESLDEKPRPILGPKMKQNQ